LQKKDNELFYAQTTIFSTQRTQVLKKKKPPGKGGNARGDYSEIIPIFYFKKKISGLKNLFFMLC